MDINATEYEQIERFLAGAMNEEEGAIFQQELRANESLRQALEWEQHFQESPYLLSQHEQADRLRDMITKAGMEWRGEQQERPAKLIPLWKRQVFRYAAILLVVLGVMAIWWSTRQTAGSYNALFAEYFVKDPAPTEKPALIADLLEEYDKGNYEDLQKLEILDIRGRGENDEEMRAMSVAQYYKGLSFIATKNYPKAAAELQQVVNTATQKEIREKATWYLSLVHIQQKNRQEAVRCLEVLVGDPSARYHKEAEELVKKL